jgi:hypothetical protein
MRTAIFAALVLVHATPRAAHADASLGGFIGDPTGIDLKLGVERRGALDILVGSSDYHDFGGALYGHLTYLVTPFIGRGESVLVPLRVGIGGAFFDHATAGDDRFDIGVRFPLEVAIRFRTAPLEIYGEIALLVTFLRPDDNIDLTSLQGGIGVRFYF